MKVIFLSFLDYYPMLYFIIRPIVRLTFRIFFSKIYLHGLDRIPLDRPVLISSNHPSAFLEACLLATHFPKSLHFLVRGDIFINKFVIWLLAQLHLIPIYRFVDGFKNLRSNESTFNACYARLAKGEIIVVYAEGNTQQEKKLRPIQKGLARIAFGAKDASPDIDLCIVPMGVNYAHPNNFRSEVFIEVGNPIELKEYYSKYKEDNAGAIKAISELTQAVEAAMKPLVIHINEDRDLLLAEKLWLLNKARNIPSLLPVVRRTGDRYAIDKQTSLLVNAISEVDKTKLYNQIIVNSPESASSLWIKLLSIPAGIGKVINGLPLMIAQKITRGKVKRIEFFASVLVGTGMFLYLFYLLFIFFLGLWFKLKPVLILAIIIITGLIYLYYDYSKEKKILHQIKEVNEDIRVE
ncbi:MAG: 1-acyl-sn-glycerol-3-phosphate acyltransferase [Saprospiraceae bacterium]